MHLEFNQSHTLQSSQGGESDCSVDKLTTCRVNTTRQEKWEINSQMVHPIIHQTFIKH